MNAYIAKTPPYTSKDKYYNIEHNLKFKLRGKFDEASNAVLYKYDCII